MNKLIIALLFVTVLVDASQPENQWLAEVNSSLAGLELREQGFPVIECLAFAESMPGDFLNLLEKDKGFSKQLKMFKALVGGYEEVLRRVDYNNKAMSCRDLAMGPSTEVLSSVYEKHLLMRLNEVLMGNQFHGEYYDQFRDKIKNGIAMNKNRKFFFNPPNIEKTDFLEENPTPEQVMKVEDVELFRLLLK